MSSKPSQPSPSKPKQHLEMLEKAHEMVCLAGLFFRHAGRPEIAERLRIAVSGWDAPDREPR